MQIRPVQPADIPRITQLWNSSVLSGEVVYKPLQEAAFRALFLDSAAACPDLLLVALKEDVPQGFLIGNIKKQYLPGETFANTPAFLTALVVDPTHRRKRMAPLFSTPSGSALPPWANSASPFPATTPSSWPG